MNVDLKASNLSAITLFAEWPDDTDELPDILRVLLPADSTVRVMGHLFHIPVGKECFIGPCDLTYELLS